MAISWAKLQFFLSIDCEVIHLCLPKKRESDLLPKSDPQNNGVIPSLYHNSTTSLKKSQSLDTELRDKWTPKRILCERLVSVYRFLGLDNRAERVETCGTSLEFVKVAAAAGGPPEGDRSSSSSNDIFKLHTANFCRDRLCPMCSWRRSYKIFGQVSKIMNLIQNDYEFLFLTLTVPNVPGELLSSKLDSLQVGWRNFTRHKSFKNSVLGYFKALEITYNKKADTFHPHYHVVLAVSKSYFVSRSYIARDVWLSMWQKAMNDYSITQVDVRKARDKKSERVGADVSAFLSSAVAEIAKYAVKSSDYLFEDIGLSRYVVSVLFPALSDRRLVSFGGCFKKAFQALNLDDSENGDLIHLDGEIRSDVALQIYRYGWSCGAYKLLEISNKADILADFDE